jgi:membrane protease YdiL (CAAX protease family)
MKIIKDIKKYLAKEAEKKSFIILLSVPIIFAIWKFQGSPVFFDKNLSTMFNSSANLPFLRIVYYGFSSIFFLFLIPALIIKKVFKENLSDYGIRFADGKFGLKVILIAFPLIFISMYPTSFNQDYQALNPMYPGAGSSLTTFVLYSFVYGLYYIGWEFFFRGFMLFGLRKRFGDLYAVLIQTLPSAIAHIGRPEGEFISSIFAGIAFGFLVLKSRSLWYVLVLHWLIGLGCDVLCLLAR